MPRTGRLPIRGQLFLLIGVLSAWGLFSLSTSGIPEAAVDILNSNQNKSGWTQTSGPLGGTVIRMIPHQGTVWASLYSGGIYELQKTGSWKQIAIGYGIPENRASDIVENPNDPNTVFVPEMIACGAKTSDGGARWTGLCSTMLQDINADNFNSFTLALDPNDPKTLYIPGHIQDGTSMLLVSTDGGIHWEKRFIFDRHYDFNHLFFYNNKMYLTTREDGIMVSSDLGKNWTPLNKGLKNLAHTKTARFLNFKNNLYLLGAHLQFNTREGGDLYKLTADGSSWQILKGMNDVTGIGTDGKTLYAGTMNATFWSSSDGVKFNQQAAAGLAPDWIGEIVSLNGKIYVGNGGNGVYVSSDQGKNFVEANAGMTSIATREVAVNPKDENEIYVGTWDRLGFYWSKNAGKTYQRVATDYNVLTLQPDPKDFTKVYLGGDQFYIGDLSKKTNQFTSKTKPGSPSSKIKSLAIDPTNSNHILAGIASATAETPPGEGLWESTNQGKSWTRAKGIGNNAVYSIIFHPKNPKIVYASALGGGVYKSTDGGSNFAAIGGNPLKYTYRLAMSKSDPNMLIASSNTFFGQLSSADQYSGKYGGIFQSKDGGATWQELTAGIRNYEGGNTPEEFLGWLYNFGHMPNYENVLIDPQDSNHLIVGHHGENVVVTLDGGTTWEKQGAEKMVPGGIHNYAYCLGSSASFKKIYACTCGRGLFQGIVNNSGIITWNFAETAYAQEFDSFNADVQPHNAAEAREFILSGAYNHQH